MLTDEQITEIETRTNAATPGPWRSMVIDAGNATVWAGGNTARTSQRIAWITRQVADNVEFIAAAREDVPTLLAEVKRLRAEVSAESNRADVWRAAYEGTLDGIAQQIRNAQEEFSNLLIDEHQGGESQ